MLRVLATGAVLAAATTGGHCAGTRCDDWPEGTTMEPFPSGVGPGTAVDGGDASTYVGDPAFYDADGGLVQSTCPLLCNDVGTQFTTVSCRPITSQDGGAAVECTHAAGRSCLPQSGG